MDIWFLSICYLFALSLCANGYLAWRVLKRPPKQESYEATQLLHDLTKGSALVKVTRVDSSDIFLWRARG